MSTGRFFYISGCKSREQAREMLEDSYADGSISAGDQPEVKSYNAKNGKKRYGVEVNG